MGAKFFSKESCTNIIVCLATNSLFREPERLFRQYDDALIVRDFLDQLVIVECLVFFSEANGFVATGENVSFFYARQYSRYLCALFGVN
jgi:hypothetical protein